MVIGPNPGLVGEVQISAVPLGLRPDRGEPYLPPGRYGVGTLLIGPV